MTHFNQIMSVLSNVNCGTKSELDQAVCDVSGYFFLEAAILCLYLVYFHSLGNWGRKSEVWKSMSRLLDLYFPFPPLVTPLKIHKINPFNTYSCMLLMYFSICLGFEIYYENTRIAYSNNQEPAKCFWVV